MVNLSHPNDKDLVWLGSGFLLSGVLLVGLPACIPKQHPLAAISRIGCAVLAVGSTATAGYCWRRWHKLIVPDLQLQQAIWQQEREELLLNQSQERLEEAIAKSVARQVEVLPDHSEAATSQSDSSDRSATQLTQKQLERLFYEGSDEVRNWLQENGLVPPKNDPKSASDKGLGDSEQRGSSGNIGNDQLADSAPSASPSSPPPEWGEEKLRDGTKWNYPEAARRIRYLVTQGLSVERAIFFLTGATSGTVYQSLLAAYRKLAE